jgi:DNA-binding MarR family transcriptional regulator
LTLVGIRITGYRMSEPTVFDLLADPPGPRIVTALSKIAIALETEVAPAGAGGGLAPIEIQALTLVNRTGGIGLERLADTLGIVSEVADRTAAVLEEQGLVTSGRRGRAGAAVLRVTPRGRSMAERIVAWPDLLVEAVQILEPREQLGFLLGLLKIIRQLQARGMVPIARMCVTCRFFRPNVHEDPERPHHCAFVDAPMGDASLRVDCSEQEPADAALADQNWRRFVQRN